MFRRTARSLRWLVCFGLVANTGCEITRSVTVVPPHVPAMDIFNVDERYSQQTPPEPLPTKTPPKDEKLRIPPELPGADAEMPIIPPRDLKNPQARDEAFRKIFPEIELVTGGPEIQASPDGHAITLTELQQRALANSPIVRQAVADVDEKYGLMVQAGLYPNPRTGYQGDQMGSANTAGQQGGFISQEIVTYGKLKLAQAVAYFDWLNAQVSLRRSQIDVINTVRERYFAVLVAQERVRVQEGLLKFIEKAYSLQVQLVKAGQAAAYEANYMHVQALQVRGELVKAKNRYSADWKQLTAALSEPDLVATVLNGHATMPAPEFRYDLAKNRMLLHHTDMKIAENLVLQAQTKLELEKVRPRPNVETNTYIQRDQTTFTNQVGLQLGFVIPVFDKNQGNIAAAQAQLGRSMQESTRVRNDLISKLADAYQRYATSRELVVMYRDSILPDQVRAFQGVYARYQREPEKIAFADVIAQQQNLINAMNTYLGYLGEQWIAVVDLARLIQTDDLYDAPSVPMK